jgi:hypothetical protein
MGSLAFNILVGYLVGVVGSSIPLAYIAYKNVCILNPKIEKSTALPTYIVLLFLLVLMLLWPVVVLILLDDALEDKYRKVKRVFRSIYDHYCYSRTSDAAKVRRLLKVYKVFKRYRPRAREEKLLKATASVYFEVMRWGEVQVRDALTIIKPKIGTEIVSVKDLAKAILVLKKPWFGCLSDSGYDEEFRTTGERDKTIELVLSEASGKVVRIYGNGKGGHWPRVKNRCLL